MSSPLAPLRRFVEQLERLIENAPDEGELLAQGADLLANLVREDGWLPWAQAKPGQESYRQYLLYLDPQERFSIVSFVWGPGQETPVHDHRTWGLVGVLHGAEIDRRYIRDDGGALREAGDPLRLERGDVGVLSPASGDIHQVSNAYADRVSISIHVYGADIGRVRRATYDAAGKEKPFVSAYADVPPPELAR